MSGSEIKLEGGSHTIKLARCSLFVLTEGTYYPRGHSSRYSITLSFSKVFILFGKNILIKEGALTEGEWYDVF